ncbi:MULTISPECIES: KilA-N domain-containing protein [Xenorhabdus]|uniref:KilA-N domain-containing protein n=1 Tax=Xenorhabdus TaxID=626 RepID=UPI00064AC89E|nr:MULTISPECIES: KilA-N domain-containing protein [Xenorhabdus]KLU15006.1 DNA-binding protein [Xenorhabdus griffiniae]KOP31901.1 DNA-binding protein [Xenorhabdus sp. GDc328]
MNYPTIVIENIHVRSNEFGTYNLNDLHKAAIAGGLAQKWQKPSQFLQSDGIREFVEEVTKVLKNTLEQNQILKINHGGNERGTWAHELIALRYAAWLSPAFEVKVYQTFRAFILGHLGKFAQANRLELEYQSKKRRVSTAARIMNSWGVGGEKQRIESDRELLAKEMQFSIPGLEEVKS